MPKNLPPPTNVDTLNIATLDPSLVDILGMPNFTACRPATIYRAVGYDIPRKSENEQAFVLFRALQFYAAFGVEWRSKMADEMDSMVARLKADASFDES